MKSIQWTSSMIFFTKERSFLPWKETSYTPIQSAIWRLNWLIILEIWKVNRLLNLWLAQPIILDIRISNLTDEHTHKLWENPFRLTKYIPSFQTNLPKWNIDYRQTHRVTHKLCLDSHWNKVYSHWNKEKIFRTVRTFPGMRSHNES